MIDEAQLEERCINRFVAQGYEHHNGCDISPNGKKTPEREDYHQVILKPCLLHQLAIINPALPEEALLSVVHTLASPETPLLIKNNQTFHRYLTQGVPVTYSVVEEGNATKQHSHAQLVDFNTPANNAFWVVDQFTITGTKGHRRPDLLVFINGLPIGVIELKDPSHKKTDIWQAYQQLQTYKDEISDLFVFNEALIISDGWTARIGSLTAQEERFMPWRTVRNEADKPPLDFQMDTLIQGFFKPELLLDYLRYFVVFESGDGNISKKIAGYHQFHAVRAAIEATVRAARTADHVPETHNPAVAAIATGSGKAGVIWHTQGSGKSLSMLYYACKLLQCPSLHNPTLVMVTDRNDLDGQLYQTFAQAEDALKQIPQQANSREALRDVLRQRQSGGIIFTTIQKFALLDGEAQHPILSNRTNIVVVSDEAHRSQYGHRAKLREVKDHNGQVIDHKFVYGYAKYLRDALPHAAFLGFTGTPIALTDKDTRGVFGDYVSIYDIQDALNDETTVPIYYESRLAKLDIHQAQIEALNTEIEHEIGEDETPWQREQIKSQWASLAKLMGAQPRIDAVAKDLVAHFGARTAITSGKAMIVAMNRTICAALYAAIVAIRPDWHHADTDKGAIKVVMTGSSADAAALQPHIYSATTRRLFEKRFKNPRDALQLVIVCDMWLTGFDAPCCHTMYVDKPMQGHNLMQAIARVNRVFKDKPGGLVVDYIGIAQALKTALKTYTSSQGKGQLDTNSEEALAVLQGKVDIIRTLFATPVEGAVFDYRPDFESRALSLLPGALNHLLGLATPQTDGPPLRDGKRRFLDAMAALTRAYALCSTLDGTKPYHKEVAFYEALRTAFIKHSTVDKKRTDALRDSTLKQILDNAVVAEGVDDIFSLVGLKKPDIGLLSDEFLEEVQQVKEKNLAVALLEKLLRDEVKARLKNDVVQEKTYSERITSTLKKYHNRSIETAQVIEELIQWAKEMQQDATLRQKLNLSVDEVAFYRALIENEASVRELGDHNLRQLAIELTQQLRRSASVDWQKRDSVRARMRNLVRRLLDRYKYPPDAAEEATLLVLKQAEALAERWYP